jgi:hypothetical protein
LIIEADGPDENEALKALKNFISKEWKSGFWGEFRLMVVLAMVR